LPPEGKGGGGGGGADGADDDDDECDEEEERIGKLKKDSAINKLLIATIEQSSTATTLPSLGSDLPLNENNYLALYLQEWVNQQVSFSVKCARDRFAWNFEQQRIYAIRFCAFLLYTVVLQICRPPESYSQATSPQTATLKDSLSQVCSSLKEEQCIPKIEKSRHSLLSSSLLGLTQCCQILLTEDSHKTLWRYFLDSITPVEDDLL